MTTGTPALFAVALLAVAASVASFFLSITVRSRISRGTFIAGLSIGTALLLGAAVLATLSTSSWLSRSFLAGEDAPTNIDLVMPRSAPVGSAGAVHAATYIQPRSTKQSPEGERGRASAGMAFDADEQSQRADGAVVSSSIDRSRNDANGSRAPGKEAVSVPASSVVWAETTCVLAIQPDPAEPTLWWLENECGTAVAILFSSRESSRWQYPTQAMVLPAKQERSITYAEQTQHGAEIRYAACAIATRDLAKIAGRSPSTSMNQTSASDDCLASVQAWAEAGRRSGQSIDAMLSGMVPGHAKVAR